MSVPPLNLKLDIVRTYPEYVDFYASMIKEYEARKCLELDLITNANGFSTDGFCYVCKSPTAFETDFLYSDGSEINGKKIPNWRERVTCERCHLNNRIRGSIHLLEQELQPDTKAAIYISEQATPLYQNLKKRYPQLQGSEYFGDQVPYGTNDPRTGFRNESATKLSFGDESLNYMLSFDVYEHIPDFLTAFQECYRCLKPGGALLFSVPFNKGSQENLERARIDENGNLEHLCEPEYHGDPINQKGCLCFHTFGWEMLDQLRTLGFKDAKAHLYWSQEFGYLGQEQMLFTALK